MFAQVQAHYAKSAAIPSYDRADPKTQHHIKRYAMAVLARTDKENDFADVVQQYCDDIHAEFTEHKKAIDKARQTCMSMSGDTSAAEVEEQFDTMQQHALGAMVATRRLVHFCRMMNAARPLVDAIDKNVLQEAQSRGDAEGERSASEAIRKHAILFRSLARETEKVSGTFNDSVELFSLVHNSHDAHLSGRLGEGGGGNRKTRNSTMPPPPN